MGRSNTDRPEEILSWISAGAPNPHDFGAMALGLFDYQFGANPSYRNYCLALGVGPENIGHWHQIPALPCDAFKVPGLALRCFPAGEVHRVFLTSGTSGGRRGRHEFADTRAYDASVRSGWRTLGLPALTNPWFLTPSPQAAPESSLVHMLATLGAAVDELGERWLLQGNSLNINSLRQAAGAGQAVQLVGTALALLEVIERSEPLALPPGSWIMETGGYKGSSRNLDKRDFYHLLSAHFQVALEAIHNEYGMTEISSPFYTRGLGQPHRGAAWTGVRVIDPLTGLPAPDGLPGYLEIVDLANTGSVLALRTQDFALRHGEREFTLLGRDPGALPRGCSRGAEELLAAQPS
jgi:hypothetical protein